MGGKVDLTGYPLRYLSIAEYGSAGGRHAVFTAVGWLEQNGWEAVNAFWERDAAFSMLVRRVQPPVQDT